MQTIHVEENAGSLPGETDVEIVERKGLGHPDTICDLVMERISQALSMAYLEHHGRILHHNCDKGLIVAGQAEHRFGGGRVIEPMRLVIGDRATMVSEFDVKELAVETAKNWFRDNFPEVDPNRHLTYQVELKGGSEELTSIFRPGSPIVPANDTSAAVGYAPLSEVEQLVLDAEHYLNGSQFKKQFPESGRDVKVMGVRTGGQLDLTVAMPLLDRYVNSEAFYFQRKESMREALSEFCLGRLSALTGVTVNLNTLDRRGAGLAGMYLSVLGTSAEDADSGEVGRGNQVNGIIALNRPRGSEAAAGKNPVSHVGKIYSVLTHLMADRIYREVPGLRQVIVWLCSRIGEAVNQPQVASVQVTFARSAMLRELREPIGRIVNEELERMPDFCRALALGEYSIC